METTNYNTTENKMNDFCLKDLIVDSYKSVEAGAYLGIFGHPIGHTLSPVIHDTLSDLMQIDERYIPFHVSPEYDLDSCVSQAFESGIVGLNITVPYKQKVMDSLVDIDPAAKAIGAVNTLVRVESGYKGYNTDMPGLYRAMESEGISLKGKNIIMLGAGGAARAVAYMCMKYEASRVYIVNRTYENAAVIAQDMNQLFGQRMTAVAASDYKKIPSDAYIFIQCTSVGLKETDGLPLVSDMSFFEMAEAGVDLIYNPAKTPFIKLLEEKKIPCMNGLKMLLYQGVLAYELWNKVQISDEMSEIVYQKLCEKLYGMNRKKDNIVLIGYMGAGKSTVGKVLAETLSYDFIDTDLWIEEHESMTIPEFFEQKGEAYFRNLETSMLEEMAENLEHTILSTGGGLPLRETNAKLLREVGKVYYLRANVDTIYNRVKDSTNRPLLKCENPYERIETMLKERGPKYENAADCIIDTDFMELDDVISIITKK